MGDDDKTKKGPGVFDPRDLEALILEGERAMEEIEMPKTETTQASEPEKPTISEPVSEKKSEKELDYEKLLDRFFLRLRVQYEAKNFFNEDFSVKDLSDLVDLLADILNETDKKEFFDVLEKKVEDNKFHAIIFFEKWLYGYKNFAESLVDNDLSLSDLEEESKEIYERRLLALGKFIRKQQSFIKETNIKEYKTPRHKESLKSLERAWLSLYLNNDEYLEKVIPNNLLRQFWFGENNGEAKFDHLTRRQKNEFVDNLNVLDSDWRRLANYTVNWEATQLQDLFKFRLEKNEYLQKNPNDLETIKNLLEQIISDAKFEAKEVLHPKHRMEEAEQYFKKWFAPKDGLFIKLHKSMLWFGNRLKKIQQELSEKKIKVNIAEKQLSAAKEDLLLLLVKMEADLLRADDINKPKTRDESVLTKGLVEPVEPPFVESDYLSVTEESNAGLVVPDQVSASKPPFQPSEVLDQFLKEEEVSKLSEKAVETESKEDYQISVGEYNFLKNVLSDEDLVKDLSGEIFEKIKALPKVVYKQDLPMFDKSKFDDAWKRAVEILHQRINELLDKELLLGEKHVVKKYLSSLEKQLGISGIIPGYDPVYDLDSLEKRWTLYNSLKIYLSLQ